MKETIGKQCNRFTAIFKPAATTQVQVWSQIIFFQDLQLDVETSSSGAGYPALKTNELKPTKAKPT